MRANLALKFGSLLNRGDVLNIAVGVGGVGALESIKLLLLLGLLLLL